MTFIHALLIFSMASSAYAQQNFFNVPSATLTEKDHLFIQQQVNIAMNSLVTSNTTLDLNVGKGFELGLNVLNLDYKANANELVLNCTDHSSPLSPSVLVNGQKVFHLGEKLSLEISSQVGASVGGGIKNSKLLYFNWINFGYNFPKDIRVVLGGYMTNRNYAGDGRGLIMMGIDIPVMKNKFHVVADFITGKKSISVAVLGVNYFISPNANISLGWQLPTSGKKEDQAVVLELTLTPRLPGRKKTK